MTTRTADLAPGAGDRPGRLREVQATTGKIRPDDPVGLGLPLRRAEHFHVPRPHLRRSLAEEVHVVVHDGRRLSVDLE